jgi:acrylyl-CoA reductase (NADPH)
MPGMDALPTRLTALLVERSGAPARLQELDADQLPAGDVLIAVSHSGINYKDALAITGTGAVLRAHPIITGVDVAGTVLASGTPRLTSGAVVFATGHGLGEERFGGHATLARLPGAWLTTVPAGCDAAWAMGLGTAGLTAALAVEALIDYGVRPGDRPVVVSGAGGGVGCISILLLAAAGYRVAAITGRPSLIPWLRDLGATDVHPRELVTGDAARPLASQRWAGGIDVVGGSLLAGMLSATAAGGCVASCGLAGGPDLPTTVMPFILRGVTLTGIESVRCADARRERAWARLAATIPPARLAGLVRSVALHEVPQAAVDLLAGRVQGRLVVRIPG